MPMTTAYSNQQRAKTLQRYMRRAPSIGTWLTDQWPKVAIIVGVGLTFAWAAVLLWSLSFVLDIF